MANNTLVSKIDGKWIHDASSLHGMTVSGTTLYLDWGNSNSAYHKQTTLSINFDAMRYKGVWSTKTSTPTNPENGDTWKISDAGEYTIDGTTVKLEIGDMIIYDENTTSWNIIQANIDPTIYARLTHTHSATLSGGISNASITPKGTISVSVTGANSTFTGSYTPEGTVQTDVYANLEHDHDVSIHSKFSINVKVPDDSTGYDGGETIKIDAHEYTPAGTISATLTTESETNQTAYYDLSFTGTAHSHTFNGEEGDVTINYDKAAANTGSTSPAVNGIITLANYKPEGDVSVNLGYDVEAATVSTNGLTVNTHSHSFTGTTTTFTGSYTPKGTVTISISDALTTSSVNYATGDIKSTTTDSAVKSVTLTTASLNSLVKAGSATTVSSIDVSYNETAEELTHIITPIAVLTGIDVSTTAIGTGISVSTFSALKSVTLTTTSFTNITNVVTSVTDSSFIGTAGNVEVSGIPLGETANVQPSISGNISVNYSKAKVTSATFNGTAKAPTVSTFSLTAANHSHSIATTSGQATGKFTPAGTIDTATAGGTINGTITYSYVKATGVEASFNGTAAELTHNDFTLSNHNHSIGTKNDTISCDVDVKGTTEKAALNINNTFNGTFTGTESEISVTGIPQLNPATGTFYGTAEDHTHNNDLTVNVSLPVDTNA